MTTQDCVRPNRLLCILGALTSSVVLAQAPAQPSTDAGHNAAVHRPSEGTGMNMKESQQAISAATFIKKASQDGMAELKLASLAQQKSPSDDVKRFAAQMQQDHSKANAELTSIAASKHITVPEALDAEHQKMLTELSGKNGTAFDAAYASHMVSAHQKAVALFREGSQSPDTAIAAFAAKTLPTLEHHAGMAKDLASGRKLAASGAPGATS
jgi:putative membrane protein